MISNKLNPSFKYTWILVENLPTKVSPHLGLDGVGFTVVPGIERKNHKFSVCYHAAGGFMEGLKHVQTRFLLILDPDLFVVRENWMAGALAYMKRKNLAFFGAPWYPALYHKWRYFPCPQFMLIDLDRVDRANLDFMPRYELKYDITVADSPKPSAGRKSFLDQLKENTRVLLRRGVVINTSLDSGWQIYQKYKDRPAFYECVQPVLKLKEKPLRPRWLNSSLNRWLEYALPDKWCYLPRADYFSDQGFKELGYFDAHHYGWDETIFDGKPFSFHMRGMLPGTKSKDHRAELLPLRRALDSFLNQRIPFSS